jgi:heat shock 70kDa protein 4
MIGESAKTQETSNFKNTVGSLKRCLGRTLNDAQIQNFEKKFINAKLIDVNGTVGTEVSATESCGGEKVFIGSL